MTSYGKKLRFVYIGALVCIAALSVASHGYLGSLESTLSNDAPVMNIAGRQLMLSQRIANLSQRFYYEIARGEFDEAESRATELAESVDQWQRAHRALVSRRGAMGLEGTNSFEVAKDLPLLDTHIEAASAAAAQLIAASSDPAGIEGQSIVEAVAAIVRSTDYFMVTMGRIVDSYTAESTRKLSLLQTVETVSTVLALSLLVFLAFAVFEPAMQRLRRQESDLLALRSAIDEHTIFSVTDRRGRILDVNDGFCEISGYSRDEVIGATHAMLNSRHHPREFWTEMWSTISAGNTWRNDVCNRAKDGSVFWVDSTNIPQFDASGKIERFISLRFDITEKKQAEADQAAVHNELQSVLNAAKQTAIIATDAQGLITMFSRGAEHMLGYTAAEALGKHPFQLYMLESEIAVRIEELSEQLNRAVDRMDIVASNAKRGGHDESRWTFVCKGGGQITVNEIVTATFLPDGEISGFVCVSEDITDKLASERRLEEQRAEQRAIIDAIPSNVWYKDREGRILDCNIAAARSVGLPRDDVIGRRTTDIIVGKTGQRFEHVDEQAFTTGCATLGLIEQVETFSGGLRHVRIDNAPLRNADGEIDRIVVISTDISDVVHASEQLRATEERLDMAMSASSTGLWDWNLETGEAYFNKVVFEMLGYQPGEIELGAESWKELCHPDDLPGMSASFEKHLAGETETYSCEYRVRRADDSFVWIRDVGQVVERDDNGAAMRTVGVYVEIQALRDALGQAERSHDELEQSKQRFELAIEGSRDAIFDWNIESGNVWFSPRWLELLKISEGALGATIPDLLWHVAPEDAERVRLELHEFVESDGERFESEFQLVDGNDAAVWVMMRAVSFRDTTGRVTRVAGSVADITTLKEAQEAMQRLVQQDHLTGLASRTRLSERLEHAVKRGKRTGNHCGVLFFDFDRFKVVNDSLGHDVGDELLCSISERLRDNVREVDTPARFGGDEFVILLEDLAEPASARIVADKLLAICAEPHQIRGHSLVSTASIGLVTSEHSPDAFELLRFADAAMYEAKRKGRACVVEFDQEMFDKQHRIAELEEALQSAIVANQLELHYQPVIDLQTGAIISAEALLRWNHPEKGSIPPADFIPIAEESKQIVMIGEWVIEEACRKLVDWRNRGVVSPDFALSVNASKVQLLTPGFERMLVETVDSFGLPREVLKIEVTETTIVDNRSDIGDVLRSLREKSVIIMMDDFGTGHSSLSVLHNLPVDELKIDQSFIRHADKSRDLVAITSSIVTLAEHLSLRTIGEGIESSEHVALLQTLGCTYGQGYFWSKPVPADEIEKLFRGEGPLGAARSA